MIDLVKENLTPRVVVVGGGITGLSAAYYLKEAALEAGQPLSITLIEASEHLGGKIITEQADGFTLEGGPDCFLRQKPWAAQLVQKLGIQDQLIGTNDHQRRVFVLNRGRLAPLPDGVMLIIPTRIMPFALSPLISIMGKLRMGMDFFVSPFQGDGDESIADFVRRRLGREALEKIAEPLLSGIHVSDPECQSLLGTFPRFRALEQKHGSLIRGMLAERKLAKSRPAKSGSGSNTLFLSLQGGLGQLVNSLTDALAGVDIRTSCQATGLTRASGVYRLALSGEQQLEADLVVLAVPSHQAATLLAEEAPELSNKLKQIRFVSTATVSLAYNQDDIRKPFMGFGFVVPRREGRKITACTWTSYKFDHRAPRGSVLLRCFVGGPGQEVMASLPDDQLLQIVHEELRSILGIEAKPVLSRIYRWEKANPQYDVGHLQRVANIFEMCRAYPGLLLTGGSYQGVGIPDCIRQGQQAANQAIEFLQFQREVI